MRSCGPSAEDRPGERIERAGASGRSAIAPRPNANVCRSLPGVAVDSYSRILWWLFSSSAGARTRGRVVFALRAEPKNALQLAQELGLDYSTVRHHLKVLGENRLIESTGAHYGQVYSVAPSLEERWPELARIVARHAARHPERSA
jgi:DNA-binding transcriptional ArsR family regulator